jgi:hypothetical protein
MVVDAHQRRRFYCLRMSLRMFPTLLRIQVDSMVF